jgi:hypothetical protein
MLKLMDAAIILSSFNPVNPDSDKDAEQDLKD